MITVKSQTDPLFATTQSISGYGMEFAGINDNSSDLEADKCNISDNAGLKTRSGKPAFKFCLMVWQAASETIAYQEMHAISQGPLL